ncbi:Lar family restriction alleviation protein [Burkholderia ubonensis]|uniref:Lar family restriction alleviation protein n=1 Tax=Burkholderia ubonensis TaxID=101571 RepID=UPI0018E1A46F|nr:Lar family restriction alleviation protein [Burkholderia ubonensis]
MTSKLPACPFCGFVDCTVSRGLISKWSFVYCPGCLAEGPACNTEDEAIAAWARRAPTQQPSGDVTEQPSLTNPLTPYGMLVRALRIVAQTSLHDMSQALLLSPAKLSEMEFGREPVTSEIVREVGTYFESLGIHNMRPALQYAVDAARAQGGEQK